MPSEHFIDQGSQDDADGGGLSIMIFIMGALAFVSFFFATRLGFDSIRHAKYFDQAEPTQGVLIERIRVSKDRSQTDFYLRYKYENKAAKKTCSVDVETKLTPRDQGCKVTIDRIQVNEEAYRAAKVPSEINLFYVPSQDLSWSQVEGHTSRHHRSLILAALNLLLSLFLSSFILKATRLL